MSQLQFVVTGDGSHTLYNPHLNEHYHSVHGAIQESKHVFINAGLNYNIQSDLVIFEVGFGTGLNAFLTLMESNSRQLNIVYYAIEKFPIDLDTAQKLNFIDCIAPFVNTDFINLHRAPWNQPVLFGSHFTLYKISADFTTFEFSDEPEFDLVYFDAFSPQIQPELWTVEVFRKIRYQMRSKAILTTYCAKGEVKRNLKTAGFTIENLPGPPGKREMTRAVNDLLLKKS
jgi:tRNA U34 5-methylaminomethyl-2-thiouridine-forming methyltransferase MnmC